MKACAKSRGADHAGVPRIVGGHLSTPVPTKGHRVSVSRELKGKLKLTACPDICAACQAVGRVMCRTRGTAALPPETVAVGVNRTGLHVWLAHGIDGVLEPRQVH